METCYNWKLVALVASLGVVRSYLRRSNNCLMLCYKAYSKLNQYYPIAAFVLSIILLTKVSMNSDTNLDTRHNISMDKMSQRYLMYPNLFCELLCCVVTDMKCPHTLKSPCFIGNLFPKGQIPISRHSVDFLPNDYEYVCYKRNPTKIYFCSLTGKVFS